MKIVEYPGNARSRPDVAALPAHPPRPFSTVLVATDLGPGSSGATSCAIELASQLHARLIIVNVIDPHPGGLFRPLARLRPVEEREDRAVLAQEVVELARRHGVVASFFLWDGDPAAQIVEAAAAETADIIIVGSRGRGAAGRLLGSVSDAVVRTALVPVVVVGPVVRNP